VGGAGKERGVVKAFYELGFAVQRSPSSGSATERELPDITVLQRDEVDGVVRARAMAIEHKATSDTTAYVDGQEVEELREYARRAGAQPYLGVKFKKSGVRRPHYLVKPKDARLTSGGNFGLPHADVRERAVYEVYESTEQKPAEFNRVEE
jgi:Holliday junction resolvase